MNATLVILTGPKKSGKSHSLNTIPKEKHRSVGFNELKQFGKFLYYNPPENFSDILSVKTTNGHTYVFLSTDLPVQIDIDDPQPIIFKFPNEKQKLLNLIKSCLL